MYHPAVDNAPPHDSTLSPAASTEFSLVRVLVVDDQQHVRQLTRRVLQRMGITDVTECEDGQAGLRHVTEPGQRFDLILSDLRMPHGDGLEFVRALAELRIETPVILLSMEPERVLAASALLATEQGVRLIGVIAKPVSADKLEPIVRKIQAGMNSVPAESAIPDDTLRSELPNGTLRLVYQPKIAMSTGAVVGVEALVRWSHPVLGELMPSRFIAVVESSPSLSHWLFDFTLREALAFAARWSDGNDDLSIAVNLGAGEFADLTLPDRIEQLVDSVGVSHQRLTLELTERSVAEHPVKTLEVATRLRVKHFGLAIDDFGTGHATMEELLRLPFNELKIDRSFVHGCTESDAKRSVVEAAIALARNLKATSVAEGIEQRPEWDFVQSLGCEQMQGNFIARPMSEEGLHSWLLQWHLSNNAAKLAPR